MHPFTYVRAASAADAAGQAGTVRPGRPKRRAARLLGPLVDATGSPVDQAADRRTALRKQPAPKPSDPEDQPHPPQEE